MKNTNALTQNVNRLSSELYFVQADYFDEGFILFLENQEVMLRTKEVKVQLYNLKTKDLDKGNTVEDIKQEIEEIHDILNDQITNRDTMIEEQEKIIQNQDGIINELRRQLKKYRFTDTINTHNLTSVYPSIMKQRS